MSLCEELDTDPVFNNKTALSVLVRNYRFELRDGADTRFEMGRMILQRLKVVGGGMLRATPHPSRGIKWFSGHIYFQVFACDCNKLPGIRLTVLVCGNTSGQRNKPFVIIEQQKPIPSDVRRYLI
jgi:hypothetical protein